MQTTVERIFGQTRRDDLSGVQARPLRRLVMGLWLGLGDMLALTLTGLLAVSVRLWMGMGFTNPGMYLDLYPLLFIFPLSYLRVGLYPGVGLRPYDEMRRLSGSTSLVLVALATLVFLTQRSMSYSRLIFVLFWLLALGLVPAIRCLWRRVGASLGIWGEPVALIGFGESGRRVLEYLCKNRVCGIVPAVIVDDGDAGGAVDGEGNPLPVVPARDLAEDKCLLHRLGIRTAILTPAEVPAVLRDAIVDEGEFGLRRIILISNLNWIGGSAVVPYDLQGILGLQVERNLLNPTERVTKRILDLLCVVFGGVLFLPLIGWIALLIKLDSPGPAFYQQRRLGRNGKEIRVWKFRTMIRNADAVLATYLEANPDMREEWEATHKLKHDPRITRVGAFLRKTSLDELPQLWNVLKGEMSLVGPRPIVRDEVKHYDASYLFYKQVAPGITGLWQVSGRSDTSYPYRVSLDTYYIRHWSIWLDVYIMLRTVWVVLKRNGAY